MVGIVRFSVQWQLAIAGRQRRVVHIVGEGASKHPNTCARQYIVKVVPAHRWGFWTATAFGHLIPTIILNDLQENELSGLANRGQFKIVISMSSPWYEAPIGLRD